MNNLVRKVTKESRDKLEAGHLSESSEVKSTPDAAQVFDAISDTSLRSITEVDAVLSDYIDHIATSPTQVKAAFLELVKRFEQISSELYKSEERFRLAFEGSKDGLFDWDVINDKAYFSAKFREMMGYPATDYIDGINALTQVVHPDDLAPTMEAVEAHLQHKKALFHHYRLRNTSGEYRYYLLKGQAVWNEEGVPTRMAGSLTDITDDLRLNRLMSKMERIAHIGAWEYNNLTDHFYQSTVAKALWGYNDAQFNLEKFASIFKSQECDHIVRKSFQDAIKFGQGFDIEVAFISSLGALKWVRIKADAIVEKSKLQQLVGVVIDITEAKKQELNLIRNQRRWKSIFTNISDLVTVVDLTGKILFQSASVRLLLGYSETELSGEHVFRFISDDQIGLLKKAFKAAQTNPGIGDRVELSMKTKFGSIVQLEAQANNQLSNPDVEAIIITCRVITERKKNEAALLQKSALLEAITKSSSLFISDIAWTDILKSVFSEVAPLLDVHRAYYFEAIHKRQGDKKLFKQVVEWSKEAHLSQLSNPELQAYNLNDHPELAQKLFNEEPYIAHVEEILSEDFKEHLLNQDIASLMVMPVFIRDELRGFMGFDACYTKRNWSSDETSSLKLLVSVIEATFESRIVKDELLLNNKRYEYIAQATDDILWEYQVAEKETKYWGSGFQHVFGHELMSNTRSRQERELLIHFEDRPRVLNSFDQFIQDKGDFWEENYRYQRADGSYVYILDKAMALKTNDGFVQSVIGSMRNVTSLKEQELQRSFLLFVNGCFKSSNTTREALNCIIEKASDMCGAQYAEAWEVDVTGEQLLYKAKWSFDGKDVFKKPYVINKINQQKGIIGEIWKKKSVVWEPEILNSIFIKKAEAAKAGLHAVLGIPLICKEEVVGVFVLFFSKQEDLSKNYIRFFEEVNTQLGELLVQKQLDIQLNTFFEHSPALLCITSGTKFIKINRSFTELLGYSEQELLERPFHDFLHPDDILSTINATEFLLEKGSVSRFKNRYITKDGRVIWLEWTSAFLDDNNLSYSIAYDITKERILELQLEKERRDRVNEVAEAAILAQEHEKEELAKELHDNVNQILATSLMYLSLVKISDVKQQENLSQAIGAVKESIKEIRQLSHALSSANLNDHDLHFALINLFTIIRESKGIEVRHEIDLLLSGNFSHKLKLNIYRIIQEQFNNIYKHAHASLVVIELFTDEDWLVLRIKDNGIGKDADKFESGIGLLNIRSRVDLFNGKMEVNTAIGHGFELITYFNEQKASGQ